MWMAGQLHTPIVLLRGKNPHCPLDTCRSRCCGNKKNLCPSRKQTPFPGRPARPDLCPPPSHHHWNKFLPTIRPHLLRLFNIARVNNVCHDRKELKYNYMNSFHFVPKVFWNLRHTWDTYSVVFLYAFYLFDEFTYWTHVGKLYNLHSTKPYNELCNLQTLHNVTIYNKSLSFLTYSFSENN